MPNLSWNEVKARAIRFAREWQDAASERADKQTFYNEFFEVFGIRRRLVALFEANVRNLQGNIGAIDLLWRGKLIVEHKSRGQSLAQAGTEAFAYIEDLSREGRFEEIPRFVLVSDFANFVLYDLEPEEQRNLPLFAGRPMSRLEFPLAELPRHLRAFAFMLGQTRVRLDPEDPANEKAYAKMCELHDRLKAGGFTGHELERLLVRILFCVFAEDIHAPSDDAAPGRSFEFIQDQFYKHVAPTVLSNDGAHGVRRPARNLMLALIRVIRVKTSSAPLNLLKAAKGYLNLVKAIKGFRPPPRGGGPPPNTSFVSICEISINSAP